MACSSLTKIPPITVVDPSVTCTVVVALWELIAGVPNVTCVKSGDELVSAICMITVFDTVICGVTCRLKSAFTKVVVTVLLAVV